MKGERLQEPDVELICFSPAEPQSVKMKFSGELAQISDGEKLVHFISSSGSGCDNFVLR